MKNWGRLLLAIGFIWLAGSALLAPSIGVTLMSQTYDALSQETYAKSEVQRIITESYNRYYRHGPWIFLPACLMLMGGFLLDRVAEKKTGQRHQGISN